MYVYTQYNNPDKNTQHIYIYFVSSYIHVTCHTNSSRSKLIRTIPIYYTQNKRKSNDCHPPPPHIATESGVLKNFITIFIAYPRFDFCKIVVVGTSSGLLLCYCNSLILEDLLTSSASFTCDQESHGCKIFVFSMAKRHFIWLPRYTMLTLSNIW